MITTELQRLFEQGLGELNYPTDPEKATKLLRFMGYLQKWNQVHNLTTVQQAEEIIIKHLLDSLAIGALLQGEHILDVGTGAGFPGLPLAVFNPERQFTLLDARTKRTQFLEQMVHRLEIANIAIIRARLEDFRPEFGFTTVVSRAFSEVANFVDLASPLMSPDGIMIAMKGHCHVGELASLSTKPYQYHVVKLKVPFLQAERHAIVIKKDPCD